MLDMYSYFILNLKFFFFFFFFFIIYFIICFILFYFNYVRFFVHYLFLILRVSSVTQLVTLSYIISRFD